MTLAETNRLITYLQAAYVGVTIAETTIRVYADALRDRAFDQVLVAAKRHVRKSPYFPRVSDLLSNPPSQPSWTPPPDERSPEEKAQVRAQVRGLVARVLRVPVEAGSDA